MSLLRFGKRMHHARFNGSDYLRRVGRLKRFCLKHRISADGLKLFVERARKKNLREPLEVEISRR